MRTTGLIWEECTLLLKSPRNATTGGVAVVGIVVRVSVLCLPNDKCCNPAFLAFDVRHVYCGSYDVGLGSIYWHVVELGDHAVSVCCTVEKVGHGLVNEVGLTVFENLSVLPVVVREVGHGTESDS